jgi:uncharacterized membrane protein YgdD (TMEM256/DUF423 family)
MFLFIGALSGLLAVAAGAFGAHALKDWPPDRLDLIELAARYQMYHALALLAVGCLKARTRSRATSLAGWCFTAGTVLFSGSLYTLALTQLRWTAWITPFGGTALLIGWAGLAWAAIAAGRNRARLNQ